MTEQYTPSDYDLYVQNPRIDQLESLITADYQPPAGVEYSFPVASQGITQDQWQQMMMPIGDGSIVQNQHESSYILRAHTSDAETNQRNTLILEAGEGSSGKSEAVMAGFFHRLTESIELPFPPVTTTTTYHVTITYDPREFKTNPLKIQVYPGPPPTTHGRQHHRLYRVTRRPNELLSQATIEKLNPWISPVITVFREDHLPEPRDLLYGTIAIVVNYDAIAHNPAIFINRGTHGWVQATGTTGWKPLTIMTGNHVSGSAYYQQERDGIRIRGTLITSSMSRIGDSMARLPINLSETFYTPVATSRGPMNISVGQSGGGLIRLYDSTGSAPIPGWVRPNFFIPDYYLDN